MARLTWEAVQHALDRLRFRKRDYQLTFGTLAGAGVLADLAKFCRAADTCFDADPRLHALAEGRREVWLRITRHLHLSPEELMEIYSGRQVTRLMIQQESEDDND